MSTSIESRLSRRAFLATTAAAPFAAALVSAQVRPTVGLELYSVRDELTKDLFGTVRAVAKMGYQTVEFYSPYYEWDTAYAKQVRALLDEVGLKAPSTHNSATVFTPEGLKKAIELNQIIGSTLIVMASAGRVEPTEDAWIRVAERLAQATATLEPLGMRAGFHNHALEFGGRMPAPPRPAGGAAAPAAPPALTFLPMDVLAKRTPRETVLQLDVGTCVHAGQDPVAWINKNPGRIRSIHCKDWGPGDDKGYKVLTGEGASPWREIIKAAEAAGGVENYLIEQEGSRYPSLETAQRCLANWKALRG
ncbi:MAG: sugar phosphate isomerase/epimerase [Acidobacteria bacterium]|nr:sugar phosphate isomerase/epimerase [Acidobacteriota bacterium]